MKERGGTEWKEVDKERESKILIRKKKKETLPTNNSLAHSNSSFLMKRASLLAPLSAS